MRRYAYEFDDCKKEADLIRDVNDFMMKTVGQHYHVHFLDHLSPIARIEALKTHLLPDSIDRDELARTFIQTVTADTQMVTNNTVKWVAEWEKLKVKVINTVYEKRCVLYNINIQSFIMHGSRMSPETERMQPSKRYSLISVQTASACEARLLLSPRPFRNHLLRHRTRSN